MSIGIAASDLEIVESPARELVAAESAEIGRLGTDKPSACSLKRSLSEFETCSLRAAVAAAKPPLWKQQVEALGKAAHRLEGGEGMTAGMNAWQTLQKPFQSSAVCDALRCRYMAM